MIILGNTEKKKKEELLEFNEMLKDPVGRRKYFKGHDDTYEEMIWNDFIKVVESYGFTKGYADDFEGESKITEHEVIYYGKENGLVLYAYTRGGICLFYARLFGEFEAPFKYNLQSNRAFNEKTVSKYFEDTKSVCFTTDVTEGFIYKMDTLTMNFEFHNVWKSHDAPFFNNYMEFKHGIPDTFGLGSYAKAKKCDDLIKIIYSHHSF